MFIACMLLHPEVQRKAQEELDRVVGRGRLPDFSDRESLPYLQCVMYETLRYAYRNSVSANPALVLILTILVVDGTP